MAMQTTSRPETMEKSRKPKDTLLEVRRIFKRIEALDDEGVKLVFVLLDGLRAKFGAKGG